MYDKSPYIVEILQIGWVSDTCCKYFPNKHQHLLITDHLKNKFSKPKNISFPQLSLFIIEMITIKNNITCQNILSQRYKDGQVVWFV